MEFFFFFPLLFNSVWLSCFSVNGDYILGRLVCIYVCVCVCVCVCLLLRYCWLWHRCLVCGVACASGCDNMSSAGRNPALIEGCGPVAAVAFTELHPCGACALQMF